MCFGEPEFLKESAAWKRRSGGQLAASSDPASRPPRNAVLAESVASVLLQLLYLAR